MKIVIEHHDSSGKITLTGGPGYAAHNINILASKFQRPYSIEVTGVQDEHMVFEAALTDEARSFCATMVKIIEFRRMGYPADPNATYRTEKG